MTADKTPDRTTDGTEETAGPNLHWREIRSPVPLEVRMRALEAELADLRGRITALAAVVQEVAVR